MSKEIMCGNKGFREFARMVNLPNIEEREQKLKESYMPFSVSRYYAELIAELNGKCKEQLINIVIPPICEKKFEGRFDPYGNHIYRKNTYYIQHKYSKTVLLQINNSCVSNCQFCYKVNEIRHEKVESIPIVEKVDQAIQYLRQNPEVYDVLLTGGDPLSLSPKILSDCLRRIALAKTVRTIRIATKALLFMPEKLLAQELIDAFAEISTLKDKQVTVIAQVSHPAELTETVRYVVDKLLHHGVLVRAQPVLTHGINDTVETLVDMQRKILDFKMLYHYISIFMPVKGVEQYGLPLDKAYSLFEESKKQLSGLEKRSRLIAPHNFGKLELIGFYPNVDTPKQIVLKWHQIVGAKYIPKEFLPIIKDNGSSLLILNYSKDKLFCIDDVFRYNGLPYFNCHNKLVHTNE